MTELLSDALLVVGCLCVVAGVGAFSWKVALIVAGLLILIVGWAIGMGNIRTEGKQQ